MVARQRRFRIESQLSGEESRTPDPHIPDVEMERRHREVLEALALLSAKLEKNPEVPAEHQGTVPDDKTPVARAEPCHQEDEESVLPGSGLGITREAVNRAQHEIQAMIFDGPKGERIVNAKKELEEVIYDTENAAGIILSAAEAINASLAKLTRQMKDPDISTVHDIQEHVVAIFQACNFQDITGQRITKVSTALKILEERLSSVRGIWGEEIFEDLAARHFEDEEALRGGGEDPGAVDLRGPAKKDEEHCTQDDIDKMFE